MPEERRATIQMAVLVEGSSGQIIGTAGLREPKPHKDGDVHPIASIVPSDGQQVHIIELPEDVAKLDAFQKAKYFARHRLSHSSIGPRLVPCTPAMEVRSPTADRQE